MFYFIKFDIAWTYYILGSVIMNLSVVILLKYLSHFIIRVIAILIILLSCIPLLLSNEEQSYQKTKILDYNMKASCYSDSIWYGYDVMTTHYDKFKDILNIGIVVNHTSSMINIDENKKNIEVNLGKSHLYVKKIFTPEHGLNNDYQAGEKIMGDMSYNIPI